MAASCIGINMHSMDEGAVSTEVADLVEEEVGAVLQWGSSRGRCTLFLSILNKE
jgi:hypothetical protein